MSERSNSGAPRTRFLISAVLLCTALTCSVVTAFANGGTKSGAPPVAAPSARPVARLLSTSAPRAEIPVQTRARLLARVVPAAYTRPASAVRAAAAVSPNTDELRAFELINAERRAHGLRPLVLDGQLTNMARYHSLNMAHAGILNHVDADGLDTRQRADLLGLRGWRALGENIAYNQGYADPVAFVVERWMHSDKHRENILNEQFTHAGLGMARAADGRVFFTEVFMTR